VASNNLFRDYLASKSSPILVNENIRDRTSTMGMTPQAVAQLQAAAKAAAAAGLARIDVVAARGGGHKSHKMGTEWDIIGYNADGTKWNNAQRVAVAAGAKAGGANRFGLYNMERGLGQGTLHMGYSGPGRPAAIWGANGLTGGAASRNFSNPYEKQFLAGTFVPPAGAPVAPTALAARSPVPAAAPSPVAAPWADRQMMPPGALGYMGPDVGPLTGALGAAASMASGMPPETAPPSPTPLEGARNLGLWDRGDDVAAVQEQLAALGFNPGKIDGVYGPNTARAVAAYQATNGTLKADAIAGPVTQGALRSDLLGPTAGVADVRAMMGTPDYMPAGPMGNPWEMPPGAPSWPSDAALRTSSGRDAALDYLESLRPGGGAPSGPSWPGDAALRTPDGRDAAVGYLDSLRPGYAGPSPGAGFGWAGPSVAPGSDMFSRYSALPDMTEQVPTPRERPSMFDRALSGPGMDMTGMGDRPSWSSPVVSAFGSGAVRPSAGVTVTEDPMKDDRGAMFSPTAGLAGGPSGGSSVGAGASSDGPPMYSYDPWSGGYSNYGG